MLSMFVNRKLALFWVGSAKVLDRRSVWDIATGVHLWIDRAC